MSIRLFSAALCLGLCVGANLVDAGDKPHPKPSSGPYNPNPRPADIVGPRRPPTTTPSVDVEMQKLKRMVDKRQANSGAAGSLGLRTADAQTSAETKHIICDDHKVIGTRPPRKGSDGASLDLVGQTAPQAGQAPKPTDSTKKWRDYILGNPTPKPRPKP